MKKSTLQNDASLLLMVQEGDKNAFDILYEKYWEQAYSAAYKRLKDSDQAKDIVQEVFVKIWLRRETPIVNLAAYLNIAIRNQIFKLVEKRKNVTPFFAFLHDIPATHSYADADVLYKELHKTYEELLITLPPKRQKIFRLRFEKDLPTNIIAEEMGISRKTVQNQLGKAVEQLRLCILQLLVLLISIGI